MSTYQSHLYAIRNIVGAGDRSYCEGRRKGSHLSVVIFDRCLSCLRVFQVLLPAPFLSPHFSLYSAPPLFRPSLHPISCLTWRKGPLRSRKSCPPRSYGRNVLSLMSLTCSHGWMFIGFGINVLLCGIMITQVYLYAATYKK